jgi:hypothetical protein
MSDIFCTRDAKYLFVSMCDFSFRHRAIFKNCRPASQPDDAHRKLRQHYYGGNMEAGSIQIVDGATTSKHLRRKMSQ